MTLEYAIKKAEEFADSFDRLKEERPDIKGFALASEDNRQLAKWLKQLKQIKDIIARHDADRMSEDYWYIDKIREVVREVEE